MRRPALLDVVLGCGVVYAGLALSAILVLYIPSIGDVSLPVPDNQLIRRIEGMAMRGAVLSSISASILCLCAAALIRRRLRSGLNAGAGRDTRKPPREGVG